MEPIYESTGALVGWIDGAFIFDRVSGRWAAFLNNDLVYTGGHFALGFLVDHFFRDMRGNAIAFTIGARPGRGLVIPTLKEPPTTTAVLPAKPVRPIAPSPTPVRQPDKFGWAWSWEEFLAGGR